MDCHVTQDKDLYKAQPAIDCAILIHFLFFVSVSSAEVDFKVWNQAYAILLKPILGRLDHVSSLLALRVRLQLALSKAQSVSRA
eukprot:4100590-Amphidinium_carterae.1